ncbi:hypothetical protein GGI14_005889 [Coemansia sp. S680]|nr:hypothetical protein GGI14_005889 [Coemansia sp. S680]
MLNHTQDGDAPGVPEVSHAQEPEMTWSASSQELDSRGRVVVPQVQEITTLEQRVTALERKFAKIKPTYIGERRTIATLERTIDTLRQALSGQQQTGISRDQVLATFSHALVTNQQANTTQQQTINTQQQTITEQHFQLQNQARRIDASNLLLARATPLNVPAFTNAPAVGVSAFVAPAAGTPTFGVAPAAGVLDRDISAYVAPVDAAQFAAILNADQPIDRHLATQEWVHRGSRNYASESSQAVKRQRLDMCVSDSVTATNSSCMIYDASGMICDVSGRRVTSERLLVALGEAPFVGLGYVQDVYRHIYGCELMPSTALPQEYIATLARVVALEHWAPQLDEEESENIADLSILCRRDLEISALRQGYLEQLGLAEDANAAVLGPRLCFVLVRMCQIPVDLLTGTIIGSMFLEVTGLDLHSLNVVTEKGVRRIKAKKLCRLVTKWVLRFCKFIAEDFSLDDARSAARLCNTEYSSKSGSASSNNTSVALDMLKNNKHNSRLFLGSQAADFEEPSKRLFFVASGNTSTLIKDGLVQLAVPLQIEASSS